LAQSLLLRHIGSKEAMTAYNRLTLIRILDGVYNQLSPIYECLAEITAIIGFW